jgi:predicted CXXCH cytochrome family protein
MKRVLSICFFVSLAFFWANRSDADEDCLTCHPVFNDLKVRHAALDMGCGSCHDKPHAKEKAVLSLTAEVPDLCYSCHDKALFAKKNQHAPVAGGMCLSCHNPHGSTVPKLLVSQVPELCYTCHDKGAFSKKTVHAPVKDGQCAFCHAPHASDEPFNLTQPVFSLCTTCHDKQASGRHVTMSLDPLGNHPVKSKTDPTRPGRELTCTSCHTPHTSGAKRLFVNDRVSVESLCLHCHTKVSVVR